MYPTHLEEFLENYVQHSLCNEIASARLYFKDSFGNYFKLDVTKYPDLFNLSIRYRNASAAAQYYPQLGKITWFTGVCTTQSHLMYGCHSANEIIQADGGSVAEIDHKLGDIAHGCIVETAILSHDVIEAYVEQTGICVWN